MSGLRVGSLFSGVGGFEQGLIAAGFEVCWQVEIDKDAISVLERHYPNVRRYTDVREVKGADLEPVDVLVGGFPCTDLSVAGARKGLAGERSGLFFEIARIAAETATPWILIENVPGLLSSWSTDNPPPSDLEPGREWESDETSDLGVVLSTLANGGYGWAYRVLNAEHFGVAQRRHRVFIIGCLGDTGVRASEVLFEPESVLWDLAASLEAGQGTAVVPANGAGSGGVTTVSIQNGARPREYSQGLGVTVNSPSYTLDTFGEHAVGVFTESQVADTLRSHPKPGSNSVGAMVTGDGVCDAVTSHAAKSGDPSTDNYVVAAPLTAGGHPNSNMPGRHREDDENLVVAISENQRGELRESDVASALGNGGGKPGQGYPCVALHLTQDPINGHVSPALGTESTAGVASRGASVRRLMPIETERLQGWPDRWTERRADGSLIPDGPRYRLVGNGVVAPVAAWIGRRLRAAMERVSDG